MPVEVATSSKRSSPIDGKRTYDGFFVIFQLQVVAVYVPLKNYLDRILVLIHVQY